MKTAGDRAMLKEVAAVRHTNPMDGPRLHLFWGDPGEDTDFANRASRRPNPTGHSRPGV